MGVKRGIALVNRPTRHRRGGVGGRDARKGQMTVEFVVVFPVLIVIALIGVNVTLFFSDCAAFDRVFRQAVCTYAVSPGYGQTLVQSEDHIEAALDPVMSGEHLEVEVSSSGASGGLVTFKGELNFHPTLFGKGSITSIFGVTFPPMTHHCELTVDTYKPGVVI